jgi:hypothetical protein
MKERSIKELLQLMMDNQDLFYDGLCFWAYDLYLKKIISTSERNLLEDYISKNAPFLYKINPFKDGYYWKKRGIAPRIKWLHYHIKKNS